MTYARRSVALAAGLVLTGGAVATADPITITQNVRTALVGDISTTTGRTVTQQFDVLAATASASQSSPPTIATAAVTSSFSDPMHWFGAGTTNAHWASQSVEAVAVSQADFVVTRPVNYVFDATFFEALHPCCTWSAQSAVTLDRILDVLDESGDPVEMRMFGVFDTASSTLNDTTLRHIFTGQLVPGRYSFGIGASAAGAFDPGSANADFMFKLDFARVNAAATPEPTSLLLLGSGLAVFAARRRSARRAA